MKFLEALIRDSPFVYLNFYAPNRSTEQCEFFQKITGSVTFSDFSLVVRDFNMFFDQDLDGSGGVKKIKKIGQNTRRYLFGAGFDRYMASQKSDRETLYVASEDFNYSETFRLWLVNDGLQDDIVSVDITQSIKSDHCRSTA